MQIWKSDNPILAWVDGVPIESGAIDQLKLVAKLPFIFKHVAAMPDVHVGAGATIGSVIATKDAIIPNAVGVDIGCGMLAIRTSLSESDIPQEKRAALRAEIERLVPTGRTNSGGPNDKGSWNPNDIPKRVKNIWTTHLENELQEVVKQHPGIKRGHVNDIVHLGTLGGGNHFIEICLETDGRVWIMLHSGSRGIGNRIGSYFAKRAKEHCKEGSGKERDRIDRKNNDYFRSKEFKKLSKADKRRISKEMKQEAVKEKARMGVKLPHPDLAFFTSETPLFEEYIRAMRWAQDYAKYNRRLMLEQVIQAVENLCGDFETDKLINCHHNYAEVENHFGENVIITRKGAVSARAGELAIIPGSMGAKSYIVEGLGCEDSFCSASHGAGRKMSRSAAKRVFTLEDHREATEGIECAKDKSVLDETPKAYKDIDTVMEAEKDLVKPIHQLRQIICVKGSDGDSSR